MTDIDCLIVGAGPASLSAAIHLAWHQRQVTVLDRKTGPLNFTIEKLHNVPGMPSIRGVDILKQLQAQATQLGVQLERANVTRAAGTIENFTLESASGET